MQQTLKTVELSQYLSAADELLEEARNGRMFILVDDEDRENEGDLVVPAQFATPDAINFMARHARGLVNLATFNKRSRMIEKPTLAQDIGVAMADLSRIAGSGKSSGVMMCTRAGSISTEDELSTVSATHLKPTQHPE